MPTSISTHISAAVAAIVAAIAALHPGFTLSPTVTQDIVVIATIAAVLLEGQHGHLKAMALRYAHEADMWLQKIDVTPSELKTVATVVESQLKPADAHLVADITGVAAASPIVYSVTGASPPVA